MNNLKVSDLLDYINKYIDKKLDKYKTKKLINEFEFETERRLNDIETTLTKIKGDKNENTN